MQIGGASCKGALAWCELGLEGTRQGSTYRELRCMSPFVGRFPAGLEGVRFILLH